MKNTEKMSLENLVMKSCLWKIWLGKIVFEKYGHEKLYLKIWLWNDIFEKFWLGKEVFENCWWWKVVFEKFGYEKVVIFEKYGNENLVMKTYLWKVWLWEDAFEKSVFEIFDYEKISLKNLLQNFPKKQKLPISNGSGGP